MSEKTIIYKFLDFEIDTALRELRCAGTVMPLQPKVFDLLVFLLLNRSRAVSKDELQDCVWAGTIVSETALSRAIMKARKAVGDDADKQNILKTVHGHGYRFIADVTEQAVEPGVGEPPAQSPTLSPAESPFATQGADQSAASAPSKGWAGWLVVAGLLTLVGVGFLMFSRPSMSNGAKIAVLPVQNLTGSSDLEWVPLGLMSLINRQIKDSTGAETVSARRMLGLVPDPGQPLPDSVIADLQADEDVSHVVRATLQQVGEELALDYQIMRPDGETPISRLVGTNPTALAQNLVREVLASLPNAGARKEYRVVSDSTFATEAYAKGLALQLEGRVREAKDFFEVSVAEDPQSFWPSYELALTMRRLAKSAEDLDRALVFTRDLLPMARQSGEVMAEVALRNAAARILSQQGHNEQAKNQYEEAIEVARAGGEQSTIPTLLINLSIIARQEKEFESARSLIYQAMEIKRELGEEPSGYIHHSLAQVAFSQRDFAAAEASYRKALELFRAQNRRREEGASLSALGRLVIRLGRWSEADRLIDESLVLRRELESAAGVVDSLLSRAELEGLRGDYARSLDVASDALEQAKTLASKHRIRAARFLIMKAHVGLESIAEAAQVLEDVRVDEADTPYSWSVRFAEAELMQARGELEQADQRFQDLYQEAIAEGGDESKVARALQLRAQISRAQNRPDALDMTVQALESARVAGEPVRIGKILLALADWHINHNDLDSAAPLVAELQSTLSHWPRSQAIRARLDFRKGHPDRARDEMTAAREQAGNAWGASAQRWFAEVVSD